MKCSLSSIKCSGTGNTVSKAVCGVMLQREQKRRGGGSFGEKLWRRLRRGVGQCLKSFLITLLNISQKLNFSRVAIEKY